MRSSKDLSRLKSRAARTRHRHRELGHARMVQAFPSQLCLIWFSYVREFGSERHNSERFGLTTNLSRPTDLRPVILTENLFRRNGKNNGREKNGREESETKTSFNEIYRNWYSVYIGSIERERPNGHVGSRLSLRRSIKSVRGHKGFGHRTSGIYPSQLKVHEKTPISITDRLFAGAPYL